jgi:hypothetical protein
MFATQGYILFICTDTRNTRRGRSMRIGLICVRKDGGGTVPTVLTQCRQFRNAVRMWNQIQDMPKGLSFGVPVQSNNNRMFAMFVNNVQNERYKIRKELRFFYNDQSTSPKFLGFQQWT